MAKEKYNWWTINNQNGILIIGILITGLGIYQLPTIFTFKSSLTEINGTLRAADTYVTNVTDRRGHESRKSELIFYINGRKQKFYLVENIDKDYLDEKYENILKGLKRAETVTVWVKKTEVNDYEPKIFQINTENETLLEFETVRTENFLLTIFMLLAGLSSIILFLWLRFPEKFDKIININKQLDEVK